MKNQRKIKIAVAVSVMAILIIIYYIADPGSSSAPKCAFKAVTGYDCPGCGSQRAFHAMLHGNIADAFALNPAIFVLVPLAVLYALAEWGSCERLRRLLVNKYALWILVGSIIAWTVMRNVFKC